MKFRLWAMLCILFCTHVYASAQDGTYEPFHLMPMPDQPKFRPETVACTPHIDATHIVTPEQGGYACILQNIKNRNNCIHQTRPDLLFEQLRTWADNGYVVAEKISNNLSSNNIDSMNIVYASMIFAKLFNEAPAQILHGIVKEDYFMARNIDFFSFAYSYLYIGIMQRNTNAGKKLIDDILLENNKMIISKEYAQGSGKYILEEAWANAERWRYLCAHPAEREEALQKLRDDPPPTCPRRADTPDPIREKWEAWVAMRRAQNLPIVGDDRDKTIQALREHLGYAASPPPPPKLLDCLPEGLEALTDHPAAGAR